MRATTILRKFLGIVHLFVTDVSIGQDGLQVAVRPRWYRPRCSRCEQQGPGYDRLPPRRWRHLGLGRCPVYLLYAPRRVCCPACGICVEAVPWARAGSRFTLEFEEMAAFLAQTTDISSAAQLMGCTWRAIRSIVTRVVEQRLDPGRLEGLRRIGIDEFSYRKRHRYLTIVVDHEQRRVVWAAPGRSSDALDGFFAALGPRGCAAIETVTIDMAGGYIKAVAENLPRATVVFDRFHVQRLISDAVDQVRRAELRDLRGSPAGDALFRSRFSLLRNPLKQQREDLQRIREIARHNKRLFRAYQLKIDFSSVFAYWQPKRARDALARWLAWASKSKLQPFVRAARIIRKHRLGILAYFESRLTNGLTEGINNRLRMIARRAFGYHTPQAAIALLFLCCGGIQLDPPLQKPT